MINGNANASAGNLQFLTTFLSIDKVAAQVSGIGVSERSQLWSSYIRMSDRRDFVLASTRPLDTGILGTLKKAAFTPFLVSNLPANPPSGSHTVPAAL